VSRVLSVRNSRPNQWTAALRTLSSRTMAATTKKTVNFLAKRICGAALE
jgi:hypothetical protein